MDEQIHTNRPADQGQEAQVAVEALRHKSVDAGVFPVAGGLDLRAGPAGHRPGADLATVRGSGVKAGVDPARGARPLHLAVAMHDLSPRTEPSQNFTNVNATPVILQPSPRQPAAGAMPYLISTICIEWCPNRYSGTSTKTASLGWALASASSPAATVQSRQNGLPECAFPAGVTAKISSPPCWVACIS